MPVCLGRACRGGGGCGHTIGGAWKVYCKVRRRREDKRTLHGIHVELSSSKVFRIFIQLL